MLRTMMRNLWIDIIMMPIIGNYHKQNYFQDQADWIRNFVAYMQNLHSNWCGTIVDIGAHQGLITDEIVGSIKDGATDFFCVEPHPVLFEKLQQKYSADPRIHVLPYVMNDVSRSHITFNYSLELPDTSHVVFAPLAAGEYQQITLPAMSLDDLAHQFTHPCRFVKIDAEGHDYRVLQGSQKLLAKDRPLVLFEFSGMLCCEKYGFSPMEWYDFFRHVDYRLISPIGGHDERYVLANFDRFDPSLIDLLAIPSEKYHLYCAH